MVTHKKSWLETVKNRGYKIEKGSDLDFRGQGRGPLWERDISAEAQAGIEVSQAQSWEKSSACWGKSLCEYWAWGQCRALEEEKGNQHGWSVVSRSWGRRLDQLPQGCVCHRKDLGFLSKKQGAVIWSGAGIRVKGFLGLLRLLVGECTGRTGSRESNLWGDCCSLLGDRMKAWTGVVEEEEMNSICGERRARRAPESWMGKESEGSLLGGYAVVMSSPWTSQYLRKSPVGSS